VGAAMNTSIMNMKSIIILDTYSTITDEIVEFTSLSHQSISGSYLSHSSFKEVDFDHCVFFSTSIKDVKFIGCHFSNCNFDFARFDECNFISCTFENCTFCITNSLNTCFQTCTFIETEWSQINGKGVSFIGSKSDLTNENQIIKNEERTITKLIPSSLNIAA